MALPAPATGTFTYTVQVAASGKAGWTWDPPAEVWLWYEHEEIPCTRLTTGNDLADRIFSINRIIEITKAATSPQPTIGLSFNPHDPIPGTSGPVSLTILILGRTNGAGEWESFLPVISRKQ
jgi:hypothetical protein